MYRWPGMVEAGQHITATRTREFGEEAMALLDAGDEAGRKVWVFIVCVVAGYGAGVGRFMRGQAIEEKLARVFSAEPAPEDFL